MRLKDKLKEKLGNQLSESELSLLPRGFQTLGKVIILKLNQELLEKREVIGLAYMELFPRVRAIYLNKGRIKGTFRQPENIEFLVGEDNPMVDHKEHGVLYRFNLTRIMFSMGNLNERKLLATLVKEGEIIVDMFAGMGYFSLPIAKHSKVSKIYSIELNPEAHACLVENIKLNHLEQIITPILGDSKEEVIKLSKRGKKADRVIMGVFPAPTDFIKEALTLARDAGTIYHYEGVADREKYLILYEEFKTIVESEHGDLQCELKTHRFVKSYGPNLYHVVLDILVSKKS